MCRSLVTALALALLAGCGATDRPAPAAPAAAPAEPAAPAYSGPMDVPVSNADGATVLERSGAAGKALECEGRPYGGGAGNYDTGPATVQASAEGALVNHLAEEPSWPRLPRTGYRVERTDGDRVLLSYDVGGRTKIAFVAVEGVRDGDGNTGWGIDVWAWCGPSELPDSVTGSGAVTIWTDRAGRRVPLTRVQSYQGAGHCDLEDVTFLVLGNGPKAPQYVRDTTGKLAEYLRTTFDARASLPEGARDTGMRQNGRELWLGPDNEAVYLVSAVDAGDVERWPAARRPVNCA